MDRNELAILISAAVVCIIVGQLAASGNIGNRAYSIWYITHFLIEKKGICNLIYFQPKHFDKYTLYEVVSFFASFLSVFLFGLLGMFRYADLINTKVLYSIVIPLVILIYLSHLLITIINDIGAGKDKKKKFYLETGERKTIPLAQLPTIVSNNDLMSKVIKLSMDNRNNTYFTMHNLWDSYYTRLKEARNDPHKQNQVHLDCIEYFKNMEHLVVVKENKNGSLQLKIQK